MRKLLIVDDNDELLLAMKSLLSFYGFDIHTATGSKILMDEIASFKPEVIILDVLLCGEDGRDICKKIRQDSNYNEIALLLFSASPKHLVDYKKHGADGVIEKPFAIKELIENIETTVKLRREYLSRMQNS
ncbi:MAG: response regulator [Ginsengibacter sp.]